MRIPNPNDQNQYLTDLDLKRCGPEFVIYIVRIGLKEGVIVVESHIDHSHQRLQSCWVGTFQIDLNLKRFQQDNMYWVQPGPNFF
jgi:hypothetical protein